MANPIDFFRPDGNILRIEKDVVGTSTFYGFAQNLTVSTANAKWLIARETIAGNETELLWASDEFDQVWDDRTTLFATPPFSNDNSIFFRNSNQNLSFPNYTNIFDWDGTTARSFSAWVRSSKSSEQCIIGQQDSTNGVGFRITLQANQTRFHVSGGSGTNRTELRSPNLSLNDDNWHHVVWAVGDLQATVVQADYTLVVDGVDQTASVTIQTNNMNTPASNAGATPLIGVRSPLALDFDGFIDEVSFWDVRLSVVEAQNAYNLGGTGKPGDLLNSGPQAANLQFWARMGDNDTFPNYTNLGVAGTELAMLHNNGKASDVVGETP